MVLQGHQGCFDSANSFNATFVCRPSTDHHLAILLQFGAVSKVQLQAPGIKSLAAEFQASLKLSNTIKLFQMI